MRVNRGIHKSLSSRHTHRLSDSNVQSTARLHGSSGLDPKTRRAVQAAVFLLMPFLVLSGSGCESNEPKTYVIDIKPIYIKQDITVHTAPAPQDSNQAASSTQPAAPNP